jgi:hypothetical protein
VCGITPARLWHAISSWRSRPPSGSSIIENFFNMGIVEQAKAGVFETIFTGEIATPMVATKTSAKERRSCSRRSPSVSRACGRYSARDYTIVEATAVLGSAIGKPELKYVRISYENARTHMLGAGLSASFVDAVTETARIFNRGALRGKEERSALNTTEMMLERFAAEVFQPSYVARAHDRLATQDRRRA